MFNGLNVMYESILIREMDEKVVDYIENNREETLPFDHVFEDKNRVVIPLYYDETASELLHALKGVKDYAGIDFEDETVIRDIPLDPKYGGGKKTQKVSIGKAISSLKIPDEKKKNLLDWFARYKGELKNSVSGHNYSIVLSRAPIDIVRMSDHRGISSCHSAGGSYFECAIQEAISGGAIAYLVHNDSIEGLSDEELQEADLFRDNDRGVRGIEPPLARLRMRRIESGYSGQEYAFPEDNIYGNTEIPGFYNSVRDFLQSKQNLEPEKFIDGLNTHTHVLRGGSYQDSGSNELVNRYFDLDNWEGPVRAKGHHFSYSRDDERSEEQAKNLGRGFDAELEEIHEREIRRMNNGNFSYDYDDNNNVPYATVWGVQEYNLSDMFIVDDFEFEATSDDFRSIKAGRQGEEWAGFLEGLIEIFSDERLALDVSSFDAGTDRLMVYFVPDDESSGMIYDADEYETFASEMVDADNKHEQITRAIEMLIVRSGFGKKGETPYSRFDEYLENEESYDERYNYVGLDTEDKDITLSIARIELLEPRIQYPEAKDASGLMTNYVHTRNWQELVKRIIMNLMKDTFKPSADRPNNQLQLPLSEAVTSREFRFTSYNVNVNCVAGVVMFSIQRLTPNTIENIAFEFADWLDDMWLHVCNALRLAIIDGWARWDAVRFEHLKVYYPSNYEQLSKIYRKYLS